jgi:flagellar basal-body rod protein FlgG
MYKGIYISLSGGTLKQTQMEVISNNLANAQTHGYKRDKITFRDFLVSQMNGLPENSGDRIMSDLSSIETDFSDGNIIQTGNSLDVAIEGKGFFSLEGGLYTRRGDFRIEKGYLVSHGGKKVLGDKGPIQVPNGKVQIDDSGKISVDGVSVGAVKIVDFPDMAAVKKSGNDYFVSDKTGVASKSDVKQGYIETSNVEIIREMVKMITALREFETQQKAIQSFDEAIAKVTNDMGRI